MFAQMMKFQMESQQKMRKNSINFWKNLKKQQRFFLELQKQQEAFFKSLSNNQPTDSTTIFTENAVWKALETFSYAPDEDTTFEAYYRIYEDYWLCRLDWRQKKPTTSTKARNCGTQQVRRLYLTKKKKQTKKLANLVF